MIAKDKHFYVIFFAFISVSFSLLEPRIIQNRIWFNYLGLILNSTLCELPFVTEFATYNIEPDTK